jgi:hypothetical protein
MRGAKTLLLGAGLGMLLLASACGDRGTRDETGAPTAGVRGPGATGTTVPMTPPPARIPPPSPQANPRPSD